MFYVGMTGLGPRILYGVVLRSVGTTGSGEYRASGFRVSFLQSNLRTPRV